MTLIDGKKIAAEIRGELKEQAAQFAAQYGRRVGLAVVLIGENPASQVYVRNKIKACEEVGICSFAQYLPADVSQREAEELVLSLAAYQKVDGILVQLPLPAHINAKEVLEKIHPIKDVDGLHSYNLGHIAAGNKPYSYPCTPMGIMRLLEYYDIPVSGQNAAVIGRSNLVGRPLSYMLLNKNATVTICHSKTKNLTEITKQADILISAAGQKGLVKADMVKEGAVVIDVGINRQQDGSLCGDIDFWSVEPKASYITPVPGGVGPMTICSLMQNTFDLYKIQNKN